MFTEANLFAWEGFYAGNAQDAHAECYQATAVIDGRKIKAQCVARKNCESLVISYYEAHRSVYRNRKNKHELDLLLRMIKEKIRAKEAEETSRRSQEDTDTKPLPPPKEDRETKLILICMHHKELELFLRSLRSTVMHE
jgi:hypothetical protein